MLLLRVLLLLIYSAPLTATHEPHDLPSDRHDYGYVYIFIAKNPLSEILVIHPNKKYTYVKLTF